MADKYRTFAELAAAEREGVDFGIVVLERGSQIAVVAPHAGMIEEGCSEISKAIAGGDLSLYLFEGRSRSDNRRLHITSARFDEPRGLSLVSTARAAIGVHGRKDGDDSATIWVGGASRELRAAVTDALNAAGFPSIKDGHDLPGTDANNICNRGTSGVGVQLEIPKTLRMALKLDEARRDTFAKAIRAGLGMSAPYR